MRRAALLACLFATPVAAADVVLETVAIGLERPVGMTHAGDGSGRLFLLEQRGRIRVVRDGALLADPFLDLTALVTCCGERGLLGLAFHPEYGANGTFFVHYSGEGGDTVVARYQVTGSDPDRADAASAEVLLVQEQPLSNHNGGQLAFGPDGYLYLGLGDGGGTGDPQDAAQDLSTVLGKILRLDVDQSGDTTAYAIPPDNPFRGHPGAREEIWAYGLRNPWRFSFDRETGDLFIGDVGQASWEEVNLQPAASAGGENYGWPLMEGRHCYRPPAGCEADGLVPPILEYGHDEGCTVIGGFRYRGAAEPGLFGTYVFADFCAGTIWGATEGEGGWTASPLLETGFLISSFGEDELGELYVLELDGQDGRLHRLRSLGKADCTGAGRLCLGERERFEVMAVYRTADGRSGPGTGGRLSPDSGFFWFFGPANVELVLKVLDACQIAGRYWVFVTGLTDVEVEVTVRDRLAEREIAYHNPLGRPFPPMLDTDAFATCP